MDIFSEFSSLVMMEKEEDKAVKEQGKK